MLWGSALAVGTEAYHRYKNPDEAIRSAISTTGLVLESFSNRAKTLLCSEFTGCNQSRATGVARYMLTGGPRRCSRLGTEWAPEAIQSAREGLSATPDVSDMSILNCASEVARKMGAGEQERIMVAGFAGGLGLSGMACGALAAAAWLKILPRARSGKSMFFTPESKKILREFKAATGSEILCHRICGRRFDTIEDHSKFIKEGGCEKLINLLASS
jgi:hypothetical protein